MQWTFGEGRGPVETSESGASNVHEYNKNELNLQLCSLEINVNRYADTLE
jgi:hypothetical protein